jgi:hypothetical protein
VAELCNVREFVMNQMKYKLAVLAVGAACTFGGWGVASAATMSTPAGQSLVPMSEAGKGTVELVRKRGGRHYRRHGGGHRSGRHHSRRHYGRHHGRRHGRHHRHHGSNFFFAAPFFYGGYYGYDYGYNSCYRECRYYNGPRYCRRHWRRYCD